MKIEYHNLYTHFVLIIQNRLPLIVEKNRERIEKYITGVVNNLRSKLYSIYANPEHVHLLISRSPAISEAELVTVVADSSAKFINENKLSLGHLNGNNRHLRFQYLNQMLTRSASTSLISRNITGK